MAIGSVVVVGGTQGLGRELAQSYADEGRDVIVTGRDQARAEVSASEIGGATRGIGFDLADPHIIAGALESVGEVDHVVLAAIERDVNNVREYEIDAAVRLVTMKLVGYTEVIHTLLPRMRDDSSILIYGGLARDRPYPGSTTVSTVNGGVSGMVKTLAWELAPIRVNAIHPGITGDSPYWDGKPAAVLEGHRSKTITQKLATMDEIVAGARFLLENESVDGVDLVVDNGRLMF